MFYFLVFRIRLFFLCWSLWRVKCFPTCSLAAQREQYLKNKRIQSEEYRKALDTQVCVHSHIQLFGIYFPIFSCPLSIYGFHLFKTFTRLYFCLNQLFLCFDRSYLVTGLVFCSKGKILQEMFACQSAIEPTVQLQTVSCVAVSKARGV